MVPILKFILQIVDYYLKRPLDLVCSYRWLKLPDTLRLPLNAAIYKILDTAL